MQEKGSERNWSSLLVMTSFGACVRAGQVSLEIKLNEVQQILNGQVCHS